MPDENSVQPLHENPPKRKRGRPPSAKTAERRRILRMVNLGLGSRRSECYAWNRVTALGLLKAAGYDVEDLCDRRRLLPATVVYALGSSFTWASPEFVRVVEEALLQRREGEFAHDVAQWVREEAERIVVKALWKAREATEPEQKNV